MKQDIIDLLYAHIGKVTGVAIGVIVGFIFLLFGFLKTVIFVLLVVLGYFIGTKIDENEDIRSIIERLLPNQWR